MGLPFWASSACCSCSSVSLPSEMRMSQALARTPGPRLLVGSSVLVPGVAPRASPPAPGSRTAPPPSPSASMRRRSEATLEAVSSLARSWSRSSGLVRYSSAPALIPSRRCCSPPRAVRKMMKVRSPCSSARTLRQSSSPSMFGIILSLMMTSTPGVLWYVSQASRPSSLTRHSCPNLSTVVLRISRDTASSSAIKTFKARVLSASATIARPYSSGAARSVA